MSKPVPAMKVARVRAGFTQTQLADLLGTSQALIARVEHGQVFPRLDLARRIAEALETTVDELFPIAELTDEDKPAEAAAGAAVPS